MFCSVVRLIARDSEDGGASHDIVPVAAFWFDPEDAIQAPWEQWALDVLEWARADSPGDVFAAVLTENVEDDMGWVEGEHEIAAENVEAALAECVARGVRYLPEFAA